MREIDPCTADLVNVGRFKAQLIWEGDGFGASRFYGSNCSSADFNVDVSELDEEDSTFVGYAAEESAINRGPITLLMDVTARPVSTDGVDWIVLEDIHSLSRVDK